MNALNSSGGRIVSAARSISDDDLCSECSECDYRPGERSFCAAGWPTSTGESEYIKECAGFKRNQDGQVEGKDPQILGFGMAPLARKLGFCRIVEVFEGTAEEAKSKFKGQEVLLITSASLSERPEAFEFAVMVRLQAQSPAQGESAC